MKVLIIEATPATPHAETGLEIAAKESLAGSSVVYCPIFHLLPVLVWRSNINGRSLNAPGDSLEDWLAYLVEKAKKYGEVDLFSLVDIPNFIHDDIKQDVFGFSYQGQDFGALVKSNAVQIFNTCDFEWILNNKLDVCLALAQTAILAYNLALLLFEKHGPDVVYFFNSRTAGTYPIYLAAKKMRVTPLIHERGSTKEKFSIWTSPPQYQDTIKSEIDRFSIGRCPVAARLSAAMFYYRQKSGKVATFTFKNKTQDHERPLDVEGLRDRFAVYYTTSNFEVLLMPGQDVTNALGSQDDAIRILARVCKQEGIQLVIKMHPGTPESEWDSIVCFEDGSDCIVLRPGSPVSSYKLGEVAFRNFSYGSTLTWEFLHNGIHCAVLSNTIGRDQPGVRELDSAESIRQYLTEPLGEVNSVFAIKFADYMGSYGEPYEFYRPDTLFSGVFNEVLV